MMLTKVSSLTPLLFRDGRPFGADTDESRARGTLIPLPSVVAGLIRTTHGNRQGWDWKQPGTPDQARRIGIGFHCLRRTRCDATEFLLPAPRDAVVHLVGKKLRVAKLEPLTLNKDEGTSLPNGLTLLADRSKSKPEPGYDMWTWEDVLAWLKGSTEVPEKQVLPPIDERVQIEIDQGRHAVKEGALFTIEYHTWEHRDGKNFAEYDLLIRADEAPVGIAHFGGEARPVVLETVEDDLPSPDDELRTALTEAKHLRCVLVTPAIFDAGWCPSWLLTGPLAKAGARLTAAAIGAPGAVSGWDYVRRIAKPARRVAPAGSVYFLELDRPLSLDELDELWLKTISDNEQDRLDGFGAALWGV